METWMIVLVVLLAIIVTLIVTLVISVPIASKKAVARHVEEYEATVGNAQTKAKEIIDEANKKAETKKRDKVWNL